MTEYGLAQARINHERRRDSEIGTLAIIKRVLVVIALACGTQAPAGGEATDTAALQKILGERFPTIKIESVQPSAVPELYEVITADRLVYSDATGAHLIMGPIMDTVSKENLTEKRWNELNKIDFSSLPFEHAIKVVKGSGKRLLVAFEDPLCPFCAELEQALAGLSNYTLYVFLLPLEDIHPGATKVARSIWCADDPAATWTAWMQHDKQPEVRSCETVPVEPLAALARKLKIHSTPTLYFADGLKVPGALDATELEKHWARIEK